MNVRKRIAVLVSAAVLSVSGGLLSAGPASAVTCYGDYCSNKDPQATGCSAGSWTQNGVDVYYKAVIGGTPRYAGYLELRGSNTCGSTQWARFTPQAGFTYKIRAEQPETGYVTSWQNGSAWQSSWSNQIYSPVKCVRAHIVTYGVLGTPMDGYTLCL